MHSADLVTRKVKGKVRRTFGTALYPPSIRPKPYCHFGKLPLRIELLAPGQSGSVG